LRVADKKAGNFAFAGIVGSPAAAKQQAGTACPHVAAHAGHARRRRLLSTLVPNDDCTKISDYLTIDAVAAVRLGSATMYPRSTSRAAALLAALCGLLGSSWHGTAIARDAGSWPTNAWETSAPEAQGMDSNALADLVKFGGSEKMDSLLVTRHGRIVAEAYYAPFRSGHKHRINSVTKAVTGTLIAIALRDGLLDSLDRRVLEFFPGRIIANLDDNKQAMTIRHLLNMTSGLEWKERLDDSVPETFLAMEQSADWQQFILDQPMAQPPGTAFEYNSGNSHLLSAIVNRLTGERALNYARAQLFGPLGITDLFWRRDPQGISTGGAGLYLQPRDMAKIGYLYLRNGMWDGRQIVPPAWIDAVNHASVDMRLPGLRYANQFWVLPDKHVYMAVGFHRQLILVMPDLDIVAIATGTRNYPSARLIDGLAGAAKSTGPLPENTAARSALDLSIAEAATERPSPVGPVPETAKQVSGKVYAFAPNVLNLRTLALNLSDVDPSFVFVGSPSSSTTTNYGNSGPLGLDGTYRTGGRARFGVNAAKGNWQDENTFVLDLHTLGNDDAQKFTLTFEGANVDLQFQNAFGWKVRVQGTAQQVTDDKP
jgi:CubicO group peptidase (beta-lactamase class C family)